MITLYFGLPGAGKTSYLAYLAKNAHKRKFGAYQTVYSNVPLQKIKNFVFIENSDIAKFDPGPRSLLLIDEATIFADARGYKTFGDEKSKFFLEHRHFGCDVALFTQQWGGVDKRLRELTNAVYWVKKSAVPGCTHLIRIPYKLSFPEETGDIVMGYEKPKVLKMLFSKRFWRRPYYKHFDSWEKYPLPSWDVWKARKELLAAQKAQQVKMKAGS